MMTVFAIFNLGGGEIVLILLLVLILFGAKKIPELAKGLGTSATVKVGNGRNGFSSGNFSSAAICS